MGCVVVVFISGCEKAVIPSGKDPNAKDSPPALELPANGSPPDTAESLEVLGDRAAAVNDFPRAVDFYRRASELADPPNKRLLDKQAQQWMNLGRPFETLAVLERAIIAFPDDVDLRTKMVGTQSSLGLQWEAKEHLQWLIQRGRGELNLLIIAADLSRPQTVDATCEYALKHFPGDLRPQYSIASVRAAYGKWQEVADLLSPVTVKHPAFLPARAYYLRSLVELDRTEELQSQLAALPSGIQSHPQYWLAAGVWAEKQGDPHRAASALWHAAKLNENDGETLTRLSSVLGELGRTEASQAAAKRSANITALRDAVDSLRSWRNDSQTAVVKIAETLGRLGRVWEATVWLRAGFAMQQNPDPKIQKLYEQSRSQLTGKTPWQLAGSLVSSQFDLSDLPVPDWKTKTTSSVPTATLAGSSIHLVDVAAQSGLNHVCEIKTKSGKQSGLTIYQSGAGGAGVIDFDLDGWPDTYLTTMDGSPRQTNSAPNRLFRNQANHWVDVTENSAVGDLGFAQGVAVGDYNSDGWPDVLVANIGRNRLYRNNGDGTFADATTASGLTGNDWTTSVAIADVDGDAVADIVEVHYCGGDYVLEHDCIDQELNEPRSCSPLAFPAQPDRIWRGLGDGAFVDASDSWMGSHEPGRGLGLIVGQLDATPGIDLYIANDMTANHYWTIDPTTTEDDFRLSQQATLRGLAVNERSLSQASMGIAAGDADRDGDIDFLVTHFTDDYNTFYEQLSGGLWADRTRRVNLEAPSMAMLGYGTQWLDFDNDGLPELFVANGNIDDFSHLGRTYQQPAQVFTRSATGKYVEQPATELGDYFARDHLGRAAVTLDANRDGKVDLLVTHLMEPVSLLINQSQLAGRSIRFSLRGTTSNRDAIGSRVTVQVGEQTMTGFSLAGDGYQCSSERRIVIGVGAADQINRVSIQWPTGENSEFASLATNNDYLIIEGETDAFPLAVP